MAESDVNEMPPEAGPPEVRAAFELLHAAVRLSQRMDAVAGGIHGQGRISACRRGILRDLLRDGPQTAPQLARRRAVSRQHIQATVKPLLRQGLVELVDNPAHRRSKLIRVTEEGRDLIEGMFRRETMLASALGIDVDAEELRRATDVLVKLRELFESERWRQVLQADSPAGGPPVDTA